MKLARYRSNSRTDILIWCGLTHRFGCKQSCDFSSLSPSVLSRGIALNNITITKSKRQTLSACLRQSILRILPFWSGLLSTQIGGRLPVTLKTKSSRHSWLMSFRSFARRRDAHFCFTSGFSFWQTEKICQISQVLWIILPNIKIINNEFIIISEFISYKC